MDAASLLFSARTRGGLSQRELAARAGTSAAAICLYETGGRVPRTDTLTRLIAATGCTLTQELASRTDAVDLVANGRRLVELLELSQELPSRPATRLEAPVLRDMARR